MAFLSRKEARIYYETFEPASNSGSKQGSLQLPGRTWVTLINGHARSSSDFRAFGKFLSEKGFFVLTLDNRGCGQTETAKFSFEDMLQDVEGLWDSLSVDGSHLLGISYGGVISLNLAARTPKRVKSLVLTSTTCESRYLSGHRLADMPLEQREAALGSYFGPAFEQKNAVLYRSLVKQMARVFEDAQFVENARLQRAALDRFDFRDRLSKIRCPTLILHGSDDKVIPPASARELHAMLSGSKLELWEGIGHLFLAEAPRRFYECVYSFFSSHSF